MDVFIITTLQNKVYCTTINLIELLTMFVFDFPSYTHNPLSPTMSASMRKLASVIGSTTTTGWTYSILLPELELYHSFLAAFVPNWTFRCLPIYCHLYILFDFHLQVCPLLLNQYSKYIDKDSIALQHLAKKIIWTRWSQMWLYAARFLIPHTRCDNKVFLSFQFYWRNHWGS